MIRPLIAKLLVHEDLTREEMGFALDAIADATATPAQVGAFLAALRMKGETIEEIAGAAMALRARATPLAMEFPDCVDTAGTGGDGANTLNISTAAALVAAAAGVTVAKHGNSAVSSRCGSADVLAALGVDIAAPPERVTACIRDCGFGFLFAPHFHPTLRPISEIRRQLGFRTLFNLLGPLINPARPRRQVVGVPQEKWVGIIGRVLASLGSVHALVVHGENSDEISVCGTTSVCEARGESVRDFTLTPEALGLARWKPEQLNGGDAAQNAAAIRAVFAGQRGAPRDAILANAGAAIFVADRAATLREAVALATRAVDDGSTLKKLAAVVLASHGERA